MLRRTPFLPLLLALLWAGCAPKEEAPDTPAAEPAAAEETSAVRVYFVQPTHLETVMSPVQLVMAAEGTEVLPAGDMTEGTGHFHVMVNTDFIPPGEVIPSDEQHHHIGTGAKELELDLPAGTHTLRLQLGNGAHIAYEGDHYRDEITITVEAAPAQ